MKMDEIKDLTQDEKLHKAAGLKEELFNLKFQFAAGHLENVMRITQVKKDIARILTSISASNKVNS